MQTVNDAEQQANWFRYFAGEAKRTVEYSEPIDNRWKHDIKRLLY